MISTRNVTDAHAQDFVAHDVLLLPILKGFAHCACWLHATRNASVCVQ